MAKKVMTQHFWLIVKKAAHASVPLINLDSQGGAGDLYFADAAYIQRCTHLFVVHTQSGAGTQTCYLHKQILQVNM